jgi:hypothetical protein
MGKPKTYLCYGCGDPCELIDHSDHPGPVFTNCVGEYQSEAVKWVEQKPKKKKNSLKKRVKRLEKRLDEVIVHRAQEALAQLAKEGD